MKEGIYKIKDKYGTIYLALVQSNGQSWILREGDYVGNVNETKPQQMEFLGEVKLIGD